MATYDYDLITIGGGSGGVAASRRAGAYGAKVALCEEGRVGGTCVLRGCVPKKLLVYGAHFAEEFADAAGFGWTIEGARHDWGALIAAKDREISRLNQIYERLLRDSAVQTFAGRARLVDAHTVAVGDRTITGKYVLLATGAWPVKPEIPGIEHTITSNEALDLKALPRSIVIVGGGYIAVEFAGIFRALGAAVTLVIRGEAPLRGFDREVRTHLATQLQKHGITLCTGVNIKSVERLGDGTHRVHTTASEPIDAEVVLMATGREPNTRGLGLPEAGIKLRESGAVVVNEESRTSQESVFAVGDCTDRKNLTPVAIAEGRAVAELLFNDRRFRPNYALVPTAVFSDPPVSTVGLTEEEAREEFAQVDIYATTFRPMKHTLSGRDDKTLMKLIVDRATQRVLGCHMVGADAPEIIQGLAVALTCGATKAQFDATIGIHPTAAEEFVTMRERRKD